MPFINKFGGAAPSRSGHVDTDRMLQYGGSQLDVNGGDGINIIEYVTISTTGNTTDFGDLSLNTWSAGAGVSNGPRGVGAMGYPGDSIGQASDTIEYVTMATTGNSIDFGNLTDGCTHPGPCSSDVRGIFYGGNRVASGQDNIIDYITITTLGNATDFGDCLTQKANTTAFSSLTRGLSAGSNSGDGSSNNTIEYITIATTGNSTDFGDLLGNEDTGAGIGNATRGIHMGGGTDTTVINYVTIASPGNAQDFGDTTAATTSSAGGANTTRGIMAGGFVTPSRVDTIEYVTIATLGNATDFGNLVSDRHQLGGMSWHLEGVS